MGTIKHILTKIEERRKWKQKVNNEARALILLSNTGLIKLPEGIMVKIAKSRTFTDIEKINQEIKDFNDIG